MMIRITFAVTLSSVSPSPAAKPVALHRFFGVHASCNVSTERPLLLSDSGRTTHSLWISLLLHFLGIRASLS